MSVVGQVDSRCRRSSSLFLYSIGKNYSFIKYLLSLSPAISLYEYFMKKSRFSDFSTLYDKYLSARRTKVDKVVEFLYSNYRKEFPMLHAQ